MRLNRYSEMERCKYNGLGVAHFSQSNIKHPVK